MALFSKINPFNFAELARQNLQAFAKRVNDPDRPVPEGRKGIWSFFNSLVNKKQQRIFTLNAATLQRLANTDPITWSIRRTIKSFVNQAEWDIIVDTEKMEEELNRWEDYALAYLSPYAIDPTEAITFKPVYLQPEIAESIRSKLREILNLSVDSSEKKKAIQWCFASATRRIKEEAESHRPTVRRIFEQPSTQGVESNFRALQELVVDDLLVYDAGVIVKNHNMRGELAELYTIPGHQVRIYRNEDRTVPQPPEPAYVWEDSGITRAEFTWDELIFIMLNPQASGYGLSPLEVAAYIITAGIYADEYNIDYFKNSNVPPGVLDLGKDVTEDQRKMFQRLWEAEVQGKRGSIHRMMFMSGTEGAKFIPMRINSNRDMQMMEYLKWTLAIKTACYGLSPQDIGFTMDFHRTTSETQLDISQARGVRSVLHLLKCYYNDEIVKSGFSFKDVKFEWQDMDLTDEQKESNIDHQDIQGGVISRNDRRRKLGLKPIDGGDAVTVTSAAGLVPVVTLEKGEEDQEDINGEEPSASATESPTPTPDANRESGAQAEAGVAEPTNLNLKVNRRKPVAKQHEMIHDVVKELQNRGVEATIKIGFSDEKQIEKDK